MNSRPESRGSPALLILAAIIAGGVAGWATGEDALAWGFRPVELFDLLGTIFINLLKMLIVPIVLASIINGAASLGSGQSFGRLFRRTALAYVLTALAAMLIAWPVIHYVQPGLVGSEPARELLALEGMGSDVAAGATTLASRGMLDVLLGIVPENVVKAAADNKILGLVLFSMLFGFFLARIDEPHRSTVHSFWQGVFQIVIRMTEWVMWIAPVGVFALAAEAIARSGLGAAGPLLTFGFCVVIGLGLYAFVAVPAMVRMAAKLNPWPLFRAMGPALLTAFSTASSSAALPISLECVQRRAGVSERVTSFVMPLGASINHAGSTIYELTAVLFIAQAYGIFLPLPTQLLVVGLILVVTMGVGGVPAASLVGIAVVLTALGLPTEAIGILLVVDRLLDMCRTAVNVLANAACTVIVARREGESGILGCGPANEEP